MPRSLAAAPPTVAVTIIARDEADRLPGCLASVAFADEVVVVVDAASTDGTERVASDFGARVVVRTFDGFGPQKNAAAALASSEWILSVDADEIVSPALAIEIRARLRERERKKPAARPAAYRVPIHLEFLGRELRYGRDTAVKPVRLYERERARFNDERVHERVVADGPLDTLDETILHRSYRDLTHYLAKLDRYTTLAAEEKLVAGRGGTRLLPVRVAWEFFDRAVLRLGFLDGAPGLTFAALSAGNTLFKYWKLNETRRRKDTVAREAAANAVPYGPA
ncbi:MAG TPA: glycosyltransferase family 2 protein [Thermoanaerobaculia bacterium]|nr:glycosyltransferase family 2 protein [Thermoanaerobaculia bacterium]